MMTLNRASLGTWLWRRLRGRAVLGRRRASQSTRLATSARGDGVMIMSNDELKATMERIARFQQQVIAARETATATENYRTSAGEYLAEIDRMNLEVREYLWAPPAKPVEEVTRGQGRN